MTEEALTERAGEPPAPRSSFPPVEPVGDVARRNLVLGLGLWVLFLLLFGATFLAGWAYLHYS